MNKLKAFRWAAIAAVIAGPLTAAMATNGYFSHGYGMKAKGMAGASVAMTDNAFAGANNPAAAAWAGNRIELGLDLFMPERSTTVAAPGMGEMKSDSNQFYVPEFGYNRTISDKLGAGVTVYGNGGMNSDYTSNAFGSGANLFGGSGRLGVNLEQLIIAPTVAYKVSANHSIGVSPLLIQQQFKAEGLSAMGLPNQGTDTSSGIGLRLGYLGKISDQLNVGVSYSPKTTMSKFSKYANLFLEQGSFDIPENYTVGASYKASASVTMALDFQRIAYTGVSAISAPSAQGGFGWTDVNVVKLGAQWQATPALVIRAGINVGDNPIRTADVGINVLAPGVTTTHYTIGGTYALSKDTEVTLAYMNAPSNSVSNGPMSIKMNQQSFGVQFGWKY